jgi:hypothetical protein
MYLVLARLPEDAHQAEQVDVVLVCEQSTIKETLEALRCDAMMKGRTPPHPHIHLARHPAASLAVQRLGTRCSTSSSSSPLFPHSFPMLAAASGELFPTDSQGRLVL